MSLHSFDPVIAKKAGINAAVIYQNLLFWCEKNKANQRHYYDNKWWTYNSISAFSDLLPYLSAKQIRTALDKLESLKLIETGCFNKSGYDRTKWYTCICLNGKTDLPKKANGNDLEGEPIPDSNPDGNPDKKQKELIDKAFDFIWTETLSLKRKFPNGGSGSKKYAKITFEKLFNKDYFKKHTEEEFKNEVNDLFDLINREAEYSLHNLKSGNPFVPFERKMLTSILNAEEWRN